MKNYEKPSINKVDFAMASKYGSPLKSQKIRKEIDELVYMNLLKNMVVPYLYFHKEK